MGIPLCPLCYQSQLPAAAVEGASSIPTPLTSYRPTQRPPANPVPLDNRPPPTPPLWGIFHLQFRSREKPPSRALTCSLLHVMTSHAGPPANPAPPSRFWWVTAPLPSCLLGCLGVSETALQGHSSVPYYTNTSFTEIHFDFQHCKCDNLGILLASSKSLRSRPPHQHSRDPALSHCV